ncbi:unnamed protein product [Menidia menidia]|uniref:(Atlantic silverside) hypothetical protein n=1 Tax=Menidia menidia TaxID=238744 RepID=A0A8S4AHJ8_9TELE|nr:unnamed protein product [Menidia menidia]
MVGGVHSLYLIVPLLLLLLIMAAVAVSVWRCHSLKRAQPRSPGLGPPHHGHVLSVVSSERWGRDYQHADPAELSVHSSPAWPGSEGGPGRGGDPPPSYEEAVGHGDVLVETEPPPQYEDIVNSSASRGGRSGRPRQAKTGHQLGRPLPTVGATCKRTTRFISRTLMTESLKFDTDSSDWVQVTNS